MTFSSDLPFPPSPEAQADGLFYLPNDLSPLGRQNETAVGQISPSPQLRVSPTDGRPEAGGRSWEAVAGVGDRGTGPV